MAEQGALWIENDGTVVKDQKRIASVFCTDLNQINRSFVLGFTGVWMEFVCEIGFAV
jgi:hypothetical protein